MSDSSYLNPPLATQSPDSDPKCPSLASNLLKTQVANPKTRRTKEGM